MILYVNGDSHAAAAEATNTYCWAIDDPEYWQSGAEPHPDNDAVSFGRCLADLLRCDYVNHSQAGGSNARIMRTTMQWLQQQSDVSDVFLCMQWSTWERQEWYWEDQWWQVNASGIDHVPPALQSQYRDFVINIDWPSCERQAHEAIWEFHERLRSMGVRHLMFNGNHYFRYTQPRDWGQCYIGPYGANQTFDSVLRQNGFRTVTPESWHFGPDAHCFWAQYLLQYIQCNNILDTHEISLD